MAVQPITDAAKPLQTAIAEVTICSLGSYIIYDFSVSQVCKKEWGSKFVCLGDEDCFPPKLFLMCHAMDQCGEWC